MNSVFMTLTLHHYIFIISIIMILAFLIIYDNIEKEFSFASFTYKGTCCSRNCLLNNFGQRNGRNKMSSFDRLFSTSRSTHKYFIKILSCFHSIRQTIVISILICRHGSIQRRLLFSQICLFCLFDILQKFLLFLIIPFTEIVDKFCFEFVNLIPCSLIFNTSNIELLHQ